MNGGRTKTAYLNSTITLICQFLQIVIGFAVRKIFISTLGVTYLGYNSVFTNILQMLNLADLGVGVAITSFLFKPIAEGDKPRVAALMYVYKRVYGIIGIAVLVIGLLISIPLDVIVPDAACSLGYLRTLFYITLAGTVSTYFLAYNRTLVIADQKSYIANFLDMGMYFLTSVVQIITLVVYPNYILFLVLQIAKNVISNIILLVYCNKKYGKTDENTDLEIVKEYKPQIIQYVKEVFVSKLGSSVFYGSDNVIISVFKGSLLTGYLSNYTMITNQLTTVVNQVLASLQATFGNYIYSDKSLREQEIMTDNYFCVNYCIGNFCMVCFVVLAQPFVSLFFGKEFVLPVSTVAWLGINLMLTIMMQLPSQVFVIYKLFRYDRPIIIVSATLNIIISVALVQKLGIDGVLIGTFVTSLVYLFSRFFIISKYVYKVAYFKYLRKMCIYFLISFVSVLLIITVEGQYEADTILKFMVKAVMTALLAVSVPSIFLSFTKEFDFLKQKMFPKKYAVLGKWYSLLCVSVCLLGIILWLQK